MTPTLASTSAAPAADRDANPFPYGWRYVKRILPDGREDWDQVPLTLEDVLHPQEGDVIPERPIQEVERGYLARVFRTHFPPSAGVLVLSDCLVNWGVEGIRNHSPDVSVFGDVVEMPDLNIGTFQLAPSGGRCWLAIEIVSPDTRTNEVDRKPPEYHQVGIPLYVIIDQKRADSPRKLVGHCHTPDGWVEVPLDEQGRLLLEPLGLKLGLRDNRVWCYDAVTGEELPDYPELSQLCHEQSQALQEKDQALQAALERIRELEARIQQGDGPSPQP